MASSTSDQPIPSDNSSSSQSFSYFRKSVCLHDWWLTKVDTDVAGKKLGVAGFTSRESQQAVRLFSSAPILKTHDVFTLETVDGIWIIIKGFINKTRTEEHGFPSEAFKHFVFGFPPYWEEFSQKFLAGGCTTNDVSKSNIDINKSAIHSGIANVADPGEGTPKNSKKAVNREKHDDNTDLPYNARQENEGTESDSDGKESENFNDLNDHVEMPNASAESPLLQAVNAATASSFHVNENVFVETSLMNIRSLKGSGCLKSNEKHIEGELNNGSAEFSVVTPLQNPDKCETLLTQDKRVEASVASSESSSFKRSRSGRLLLPTMEFWRNQLPIYDADRQIIGIKEGNAVQPLRGCISNPQKKRQKLK